MADKKPTNDLDQAELVAYLDGELDEAGNQSVEQLLSESEAARWEAEVLARTWEMLDALPTAQVPSHVTSRTLEHIKSDLMYEKTPGRRQHLFARRATLVTGWAASIALAASVGFATVRLTFSNPSALLIEDLPLVEQLPAYLEVGAPEFLRSLQARGIDFESEVSPDGT